MWTLPGNIAIQSLRGGHEAVKPLRGNPELGRWAGRMLDVMQS